MNWKELARIALLGTDHSALPEGLPDQLAQLGLPPAPDDPARLAAAAAWQAQVRKVGFRLRKFAGQRPVPLSDGADHPCSLKSANHLRLILDGKYGPALPEFMARLLENGRNLPTEHLPELLQRPDLHEWWDTLRPALGPRGEWLLAQHPEWKIWVEKASQLSWETGSQAERLRLFRHWRQHDPARARQMLAQTWEQEDHRGRTAFLAEMETGLTTADEAFLEAALDDRRKTVRRQAAALLTLLPDSELGERMFRRAAACFSWQRGRLQVNLPDEPDEPARRDGVLAVHPGWPGGAKAGYLGQVVAAVPPSRWELHWDLDPLSIWNQFSATDWGDTLQLAVGLAAHQYEDATWQKIVLEAWFDDEESPLWNSAFGQKMLTALPGETVNELALEYLRQLSGLPDEETPFFQLLDTNDAPWERELSNEIVGRFQQFLRQRKQVDFSDFFYHEYLKMAAYRSPPGLFATWQKGWDENAYTWPHWQGAVEEMLEVVFFRQEMVRELEKG